VERRAWSMGHGTRGHKEVVGGVPGVGAGCRVWVRGAGCGYGRGRGTVVQINPQYNVGGGKTERFILSTG
jgi:hypothetical protein